MSAVHFKSRLKVSWVLALALVAACSNDGRSERVSPSETPVPATPPAPATPPSGVTATDNAPTVFAMVEARVAAALPPGACATFRSDGSCGVPKPGDQDGDGYPKRRDCNDLDPNVHPDAPEIRCNLLDENCDGADECPRDADADGFDITVDCDDDDAAVNPAAPEIRCNGRDENCSATDECDADGDGHDTERPLRTSYTAITHWISNDCNDADPTVYAGAPEIPCDGIDQNCDGVDSCDKDDRGIRLACRVDNPYGLGPGLNYCAAAVPETASAWHYSGD